MGKIKNIIKSKRLEAGLRTCGVNLLGIAVTLLGLASAPARALADDLPSAVVVKPEKKPEDKTPSLVTFSSPTAEVKRGILEGQPIVYAVLEGRFTPPEYAAQDWSLISDIKTIRTDEKGVFRFNLVLAGQVTRVDFVAVSPKGNVYRDQVGVIYDAYDSATTVGASSFKERAYLAAGLGVSALDYRDSTRSGISQTTLIGKLSLDQPIGRGPWILGVNFFSTFAEFSKSTTSSTQIFGANARIGYRVLASGRWTLRVYLGLYYTTTYGGSGDFGYSNLMGPQIYPAIAYRLGSGAVAAIYLKYSLVSSGFTFYSTDNREFAAGAQYFFAPFKSGWLGGKCLGLTADFSWLSLKSATLGTSTFDSMSFGTALKF